MQAMMALWSNAFNMMWAYTSCLEYLHVKAVGDYEPQALDELNLKTGDIVRVYRVTNG